MESILVKEKYRICLIEDDKTDQIAFQKMISSENISVTSQQLVSVVEAKMLVQSNDYDVIILDYMLEDGTAFDVLEHVEKTPVIVTTGAGDEEIAIKMMKSGAHDYLVKDMERNYLKILPITIKRTIKQSNINQELKDLSNLHKAIVDNSFDSLVVIDNESKINFANNSFVSISKYTLDELINTTMAEIGFGKEFVNQIVTSVKKGEFLKDMKTILVPKNGPNIPVAVSVSPIPGQNKLLFCFRDLRIDKDIRKGIEHFQRFVSDHVKVSLFRWGLNGQIDPIVSESLSFAKLEKETLQKMGVFYLTALTQGNDDSDNLGLFGPFPIPDTTDYIALTYSFKIADSDTSSRSGGYSYAFLAFSIPKTLEQFFTNRKSISQIISKNLEPMNNISDFDLTAIQLIKFEILNLELN